MALQSQSGLHRGDAKGLLPGHNGLPRRPQRKRLQDEDLERVES